MRFEHYMDSEGFTSAHSGWKRVFAIGDVHGDLPALLEIFYCLELIDSHGHWRADRRTLVVLAGDLVDRGGDSANLVAYVARLQDEANAAGSHVELLLGNHEVMAAVGDFRYMCPMEGARLADIWIDNQNGPHAIFRGTSSYAKWLKNRPLAARIGKNLLIHAGVGSWFEGRHIDEINELATQWMGYFQGNEDVPPRDADWLIADDGPLWTRAFGTSALAGATPQLSRSELRDLLAQHKAERLLVGHCPTIDIGYQVSTAHPVYGESVVNLDTGISYCFQGRLSVVEITAHGVQPMYFGRQCRPDLVAAVRRACHMEIVGLSDHYAASA